RGGDQEAAVLAGQADGEVAGRAAVEAEVDGLLRGRDELSAQAVVLHRVLPGASGKSARSPSSVATQRPRSVTSPVTRRAGVTSKAGLTARAPLGAVSTETTSPRSVRPSTSVTSEAARSSIGIAAAS